MQWWQLIIYGVISFGAMILSGISGGGGGFIMTPLAIFLGLAPAQAISSSKFNGLAGTIGSLTGLRKYKSSVSKRRIAAIMVLAFLVGLLVPFVIKSFESRWYRLTLGIILLLMIPVMIYRKIGIKPHVPSRAQKAGGTVLLTASLFLQGSFSGGLGSLVNVVLMGMLGMTANEAHIVKRCSQFVLNITIIFGVMGAKLIVWPVALVGIIVSFAGTFIGSHIAVKKGDKLAVNVLLLMMCISALVLIVGAL